MVFRVRRIRRNGKLPEPRPFILVLDLAHPHRSHHGLITDFNIRIDAQIVHPNRIRWRPALRSDEDVTIAVLNALQWGSYGPHRFPIWVTMITGSPISRRVVPSIPPLLS